MAMLKPGPVDLPGTGEQSMAQDAILITQWKAKMHTITTWLIACQKSCPFRCSWRR